MAIVSYYLRYDPNGGSGGPGTVKKTGNAGSNGIYNATIDYGIPTRSNYSFAGWQYGSKTYYGGDLFPGWGDASGSQTYTLYAQWDYNPPTPPTPTYYYATLSFDANGGSGEPETSYGYSEADTPSVTIYIPSQEPYWANHIFVCWDLGQGSYRYAKYGGTGIGTTQSSPRSNYILSTWGTVDNPQRYTATAIWDELKYYYAKLSFDANGGTGAPSAITGVSNANSQEVSITIPSTIPTRPGYNFVCWDLGQGSNRYAKYGGTGDGTSMSNPNKRYLLYSTSQSINYPASYTATAIWEEANTGSVWVRNSNGAFRQGTPYVYSGGVWRPATAYICNGSSWSKCL